MDTLSTLALLLLILDVVLVVSVLRAEQHLDLERAAEAGPEHETRPKIGPGST